MFASMAIPRAPIVFREGVENTLTIAETNIGDLERIMRITGVVGVDGYVCHRHKNPRLRIVCTSAGVCNVHPIVGCTTEKAMLHLSVFGDQTVPRAECFFVICVLRLWDGSYPLTIIIVATYTMQGLAEDEADKHLKGTHGDLWKVLYAKLAKYDARPRVNKSTLTLLGNKSSRGARVIDT